MGKFGLSSSARLAEFEHEFIPDDTIWCEYSENEDPFEDLVII